MVTQIGITILVGLAVSAVLTKLLIPYLRKKAGQNIREEGPESHKAKAGTPSMGGIAIIGGTIIATLVTGNARGDFLAIALTFVLFGLMGFLDDALKVVHKENLGLRAWQKLVLQIAIGVAAGIYMMKTSVYGTGVAIPFTDITLDIGIWYVPFIAFVLVAMANGVNLTDGLDGLAAGVTSFVALFFAVAGAVYSYMYVANFSAALTGACIGFLIYNRNPARIFMGDTGSLALGGGIAMIAIVMHMELLLPIVGLIYVLEVLSVMIQVASFKLTGKRVFKMAPLHHHFELCGMSEKAVVAMFWLATILFCAIGFLAL